MMQLADMSLEFFQVLLLKHKSCVLSFVDSLFSFSSFLLYLKDNLASVSLHAGF